MSVEKRRRMRFERESDRSGRIFYGKAPLADVRDLTLCNVRFRPAAEPVIGCEVPVPLYWRQYHGHEDPERSAASFARIERAYEFKNAVFIRITSENASRCILSETTLVVLHHPLVWSVEYIVDTRLSVQEEGWVVTPHADHGDLEFLDLWPLGTFDASGTLPKRFTDCLVVKDATVVRIPHHHFETREKKRIPMRTGDMLVYVLEDVNPVVEVVAGEDIEAGICAYMWDVHFGVRVCRRREPRTVRPGETFRAAFRLFAIRRRDAAALLRYARHTPDPSLASTPVYREGMQSFDEGPAKPDAASPEWPWSFEGGTESAEGTVDRLEAFGQGASLAVHHPIACTSRWVAHSIGPAFGGEPFADGTAYRLTAMALLRDFHGTACVAFRLHRQGAEGLHDTASYERYEGTSAAKGKDWVPLYVETPPLSPPPDRLHLVLEAEGTGICRFDHVLFERIPPAGENGGESR
ncbi:MAG: hypothetical protein QHI48_08280 [Bacteroidota bacterium]|nr:hypothetical protein [Bacteroidota bacterium]